MCIFKKLIQHSVDAIQLVNGILLYVTLCLQFLHLIFKFFSFMGSLPRDFLIRGSAPGLARGKDSRLSYVHPCMPVIPLVPSDPPTLISSLLRLSAHHLALAASASQLLKFRTLSLHLSVPVPVLTPFVVTSRPATASRPSNQPIPSPLAPQIRLC